MAKLEYKKKTVSARKKEALAWYKDIVGSTKPTASNFNLYQDETGMKGKIGAGYMNHFTYLAKHRDKLPYWDTFPLSLTIDVGKDYLLDLNLHYVSPTIREKFLKILYNNMMDKGKSSVQKAKFNYAMMAEAKKYSFMKPAIKKHLFSQIKTKPILIRPSDWDKVIFLPSEDFVGASTTKVWRDSSKAAKKY